MTQDSISKAVVLLLALGVSAVFLAMVHQFLMALFLAGVFAALSRPFFLRLVPLFGGRRWLAAFVNLTLMAVMVFIPLILLAGVLVAQAVDVSESVSRWVRDLVNDPGLVQEWLAGLPFYEELLPYWGKLAAQMGDAVGAVSKVAVEGLSSLTLGVVNFVFMTFVFLYSLYFLQLDGDRLMARLLYYLPLKEADERILVEKFHSVTRATLRGSLLIGLLQGGLAGIAFAVAGIPNAVFWGAVMAVMSMIPNVGAALVWIPASVALFLQGEQGTAIGLAVFCAVVVGSLDNLLRPILVGKDTKLHELLIFFSTLGGIFMFGFPGILIGPLIASLFVSIWEIYGVEFADYLPAVSTLDAPETQGTTPIQTSEPPLAAADAQDDGTPGVDGRPPSHAPEA